MYLGTTAQRLPDRDAVVIPGVGRWTYAALDARSNQAAHGLYSLGLNPGDGVLMMLENRIEVFEIWWATMRAGLRFTPVNWHLMPGEVSWLVQDSGARAIVYSAHLADVVDPILAEHPELVAVSVGSAGSDARRVSYDELLAAQPQTRLDRELGGATLLYSSGTTGRPKGIRAPFSGGPPDDGRSAANITATNFSIGEDERFLSTGPLYHGAPLLWSTAMHTVGSTVIVMERFDAAGALGLLMDEQITVSQWVPTMFTRLLALPDEVREAFAAPAHRAAWHAAAPCPVALKQAMLDWWGPIIWEYYSGSEAGGTVISPVEWLARPGSVGRHWRGGTTYVFDPATERRQPPNEPGLVYFETYAEYRADGESVPAEPTVDDLITLGEIGYVDEDGYLFLTDRRTDMIVSGGVNIYPREIEDVLMAHPGVLDAAVFGIPDAEFGESVYAVVQPAAPVDDPQRFERELDEHCRAALAGFKRPRRYEFVPALPRDANGKLYKRRLREPFWRDHDTRVI